MGKNKMPIEWIVGMMMLGAANLLSLLWRQFAGETPSWIAIVQLVTVSAACVLLVLSAPKLRELRKVRKENKNIDNE